MFPIISRTFYRWRTHRSSGDEKMLHIFKTFCFLLLISWKIWFLISAGRGKLSTITLNISPLSPQVVTHFNLLSFRECINIIAMDSYSHHFVLASYLSFRRRCMPPIPRRGSSKEIGVFSEYHKHWYSWRSLAAHEHSTK